MCQYCHPLIKAIDNFLVKADDDMKKKLKDAGIEDPDGTMDDIDDLESLLEDALLDDTAYIISRASEAVDLDEFRKMVWPDVKLNDELRARLAKIFQEKFSAMLPNLTQLYLKKTDNGLYVTRISERSLAWVESWSNDLASMMKLTSNNEIERILTQGLKDGIGIDEFTRQIQESGIREEYYRARTTAVTEVLRAHSVAAQEAFMQSPSVTGKMWRHSGAYRIEPRWNHVDMDGQVVPVDEEFTLYGADGNTYYPMYPRDASLPPGESINCHCIIEPVVDEDILGLSLEERMELQQEAIDTMDDDWEAELDAQIRAERGIEL